ncbi:histidine ammonia-lyase [Azospirillum lipoferum]|uniref:aromatic amino acid lyase n=1 Tax=Azospirillum TaxID=191 RepID=UPI001FE6F0D5|nr:MULTISPECIES: aromatic amino acid lyase [Azospirillum]MCP1610973.1 histidine ammonia-lyase [Azospirillum lipoferum]MDW5533893.1 aromatic amino acid lyase [Azospirillum sp. NL1]
MAPTARAVGVGPRLPTDILRALMLVRAAGYAAGGSGASPTMLHALVAALNAGFHPLVPSKGSIGADDLAPLAHLGRALLGDPDAEVEIGGDILPADAALARAGLTPPVLGLKDGHTVVVANALSVGQGCLVLEDARVALDALDAAAALSCEGFRAQLEPLDPRVQQARPAPGQAEAAARLRALLAGSGLEKPGAARRLQDPLSFRCLAPVHGAARVTLEAAREPVAIELNAAADNPLVAVAEAGTEGGMLHNGNFDMTALVLRFEALGQALAQAATMAAHRTMKLMSPTVSDLPRFLTPQGQSRTGFATVQKTIAALEAEIRHLALPASLGVLPVADGIEDHASMAPAVVAKTGGIVERLRWLTAIELAAAAQAVDLRGPLVLGAGTRAVHAFVRSLVAPLEEDRSQGPDFERLAQSIAAGALQQVLAAGG